MLRKGFTLIELLIVLGVMGILAAMVLVAINPTKQLSDARGASRTSSIRELENSVSQYIIGGNVLGSLPAGAENAIDVCQDTVSPVDCVSAAGFDLSFLTPGFVVNLPIDPNETGNTFTGYRIYLTGSFIKICSPVLDPTCG